MKIVDRICKYLDVKGITRYRFYKDTGLSNGFLDKKGNIGSDKCERIIYLYPDINPEWLLTGQGEMLRTAILIESIQSVSPPPNDDIITLLKEQLKEKDTKIEIQAQEIGELRSDNRQLKEQIMGLDQQILKLSISLSKFQSTAGDAPSVHALL